MLERWAREEQEAAGGDGCGGGADGPDGSSARSPQAAGGDPFGTPLGTRRFAAMSLASPVHGAGAGVFGGGASTGSGALSGPAWQADAAGAGAAGAVDGDAPVGLAWPAAAPAAQPGVAWARAGLQQGPAPGRAWDALLRGRHHAAAVGGGCYPWITPAPAHAPAAPDPTAAPSGQPGAHSDGAQPGPRLAQVPGRCSGRGPLGRPQLLAGLAALHSVYEDMKLDTTRRALVHVCMCARAPSASYLIYIYVSISTLNLNLGSHGGVRTACGRDERTTLRRSRPFEMYDTN